MTTHPVTAPSSPPRWGPNRLPVPHVALWSAETPAVRALTLRPGGRGLAYRDEVPGDRDRHGVLWARVTEAPGVGRPRFGDLHPGRQRRAVLGRLCQVCGGPASHDTRGWLFLLPGAAGAGHGWPKGALCTKPPVCEPCAAVAVRHCPHLVRPVLVRCRKPRVWGVFGGWHVPGRDGRLRVSGHDGRLPYGHPTAPWFLANQLVVELTRCTAAPVPPLRTGPRPA